MSQNTRDTPPSSFESNRAVRIVPVSSTSGCATSTRSSSGTPLPDITDGVTDEQAQEIERQASLLRTSRPGQTTYRTFENLGLDVPSNEAEDSSTIRNLSHSSPVLVDERGTRWCWWRLMWDGLFWVMGGCGFGGRRRETAAAALANEAARVGSRSFDNLFQASREQHEQQWSADPIPREVIEQRIRKRERFLVSHANSRQRQVLEWQIYLYQKQLNWVTREEN